MPIPVNCSCGRALRIKDELAGRQIYCPTCKSVLLVPNPASEREPEPETDLEVVEDEPGGYDVVDDDDDDRPRRKKSREAEEGVQTTRRASRSAPGEVDEDDEDDERSRREERRRDDERAERRAERKEEEEREDRRRKRRRREEARRIARVREPRASFDGSMFGSINSGVVGGLVMVVLGLVGTAACLMVGIIWVWPIILTVIGIVAIIKGLSGE
jgi:hypothetical protein